MFTSQIFASILPEILILVLGVLILIFEPFWKEDQRRNAGWLTAGGLLAAIDHQSAVWSAWRTDFRAWRDDPLRLAGFLLQILFMFAGAATALLLMDHEKAGHRGEAYVLLLASLLGMNLMAVSSDLVMLYLAIETASIPLYILAGFLLADERSTEAGFKYLLFGTLASTIMLYGFSLIFGFSGTTDLLKIAEVFTADTISPLLAFGVLALVIVGLGFKMAIVPFHFWAPDVYQGSPTPVAGFLSTASKAAGFAVVVRFFFVALPAFAPSWTLIFAALAAITMTVGNLLALTQTNIKRLLAYSSIAHAGMR
jgi:NADH-quinone oxidoreductase subunit N